MRLVAHGQVRWFVICRESVVPVPMTHLIINTNWDDKITKETNWKQHNRETPK